MGEPKLSADAAALATAVGRNELTPEDADELARERGIRLSGRPTEKHLDVLKEREWSLPMAIAWIVTRDTAHVQENWDDYRREWRFWKFLHLFHPYGQVPVESCWLLLCHDPADLDSMSHGLASTPAYVNRAEPDIAKRMLLESLSCGRLTARGVRDRALVEIPQAEWSRLEIVNVRDGTALSFRHAVNEIVYFSVGITPRDLMAEFPPDGSLYPPETHTGLAGRPTSRHLIDAQFSRMVAEANLPDSLSATAAELREWHSREHPQLALPSKKTIENNIRAAFNAARQAPK